jgi:indolepyruvate ferredoxin oxidoreductase beta subunit
MDSSGKKVVNVVFAGLGGQGVIKASDMLVEAAFRMGYDVKKSELHGMSQRGGSVSSEVRFGSKVWSPMGPAGEGDYLVAVSEDQVAVVAPCLKPGAVIVKPSDLGHAPEESGKTLNIELLGLLNSYLKFPVELWESLIKDFFPAELVEMNLSAFHKGGAKR